MQPAAWFLLAIVAVLVLGVVISKKENKDDSDKK